MLANWLCSEAPTSAMRLGRQSASQSSKKAGMLRSLVKLIEPVHRRLDALLLGAAHELLLALRFDLLAQEERIVAGVAAFLEALNVQRLVERALGELHGLGWHAARFCCH